jgi:hypothetical protein
VRSTRRRSSRVGALLALAALSACSQLPDVPANQCGNHVLEAGEDCDEAGPGCGAPGGPGACRFVCAATGTCSQTGYACGLDKVCRRPSGTYTLADPIGMPGEQFEVVDLDGDGRPDVAARGNRDTTLYRNFVDASGAHLLAMSSGPLHADDSLFHGITIGRFAAGDSRPLLAVITISTVDVYALTGDPQPAPVAFASVLLPHSINPPRFLGAVKFAAGEPSLPLFYHPDGPKLIAWDGSGDAAVATAELDLRACGAIAGSTVESAAASPTSGDLVALLVDGKHACVVQPRRTGMMMSAELHAVPLDVKPLTGLAAADRIEAPVFADVNGDHCVDLVALVRHPTGDMMNPVQSSWVTWLRDPMGGPASTANVGAVYVPYYNYQAQTLFTAADFDGDGFDDIADSNVVLLNAQMPGAFATTNFELTPDNIVYFGPGRGAGDLNHDGTPDLLLTSVGEGIVTTCLCDGRSPPGFSCFTNNTGLPSIGSLAIGDFNGDLTLDVAALGDMPQVTGGENQIRLIYGHGLSLPTAAGVGLTPYHAQAIGIAPSIGLTAYAGRAPGPANDLLVALDTGGGTIGLARGQPVEGAPPAFGLNIPGFDVDFAQGAAPALRVLRCDQDPPDTGPYVDCKVQVYGSASPGTAFATPVVQTFDRKFPAGLDAYITNIRLLGTPDDPQAVTWIEPGGAIIAHVDAASGSFRSSVAAATDAPLDGATFYAYEDANGDGRNELLVQTIKDGSCRGGRGSSRP